jgi:hypothetical protein
MRARAAIGSVSSANSAVDCSAPVDTRAIRMGRSLHKV